jgi:hypothetical protein
MARKKLQVFVSSTYKDMIAERQIAVEAILQSGHIPAGMELFAAGDRSQLDVIRKWIDESDVFMLILGGRYGSIDKESGKSYIHLECEHALTQGKPLFAIVAAEEYLTKKAKKKDLTVIEREHAAEYNEFKTDVLSRLCRFFEDLKDIKIAIHESLASFEDRDLVGWVKANEVGNSQPIIDELGRLGEENQKLKADVATLRTQLERWVHDRNRFGEYTFEEIEGALRHTKIGLSGKRDALAESLDHEAQLVNGVTYHLSELYDNLAPRLAIYGLAEIDDEKRYVLTPAGRRFLALVRIKLSATNK